MKTELKTLRVGYP